MHGGMGGGMHGGMGGGCISAVWAEACMSAVWGEARISVAAVSAGAAVRPCRVSSPRFSRFAHDGFHQRFFTTDSIALRSLAALTPMPRTTAVGAGCGRHMDCSGSMSAAIRLLRTPVEMHRG